jgi:hypothetical protein
VSVKRIDESRSAPVDDGHRVLFEKGGMKFIEYDQNGQVVVLGVTGDTKDIVIVGTFKEPIPGKVVFFPAGVGIELADMQALLEAYVHLKSGV